MVSEGCGQGLEEGTAKIWPEVQVSFIVPLFSHPQPLGSSGSLQQGIMGLVVFSVRSSGPGCLEVH